jgi:N-acetylglucosamine kinase-like BadF-type ATPase
MVVLGIDAGGTKTVCQLADGEGRVLAEARGPGANLQADGEIAVEQALRQVIARALEGRGARVDAMCLGMAGVDRPRDAALAHAVLSRVGVDAQRLVVNDALIALEAAFPGAPGLVIVSGTGSIAYGRDGSGRAARAGGWGYGLGDEGSGYWLGRLALRAVVRAADGRGTQTSLTAHVLAHYDVARAQDLVHEIYTGMKPSAIAALAPLVQAAADEGDAVALHVIDAGARELGLAGSSVARRLGLDAGPVSLAGGVFRAVPRLCDGVTAILSRDLPSAPVERLSIEPALGAVRLALSLVNGRPAVPIDLDARL